MSASCKTNKHFKMTAATYLAVNWEIRIDCFCFSSLAFQCCSPANRHVYCPKTHSTVMQKVLCLFFCSDSGSDADSFYGSVERPIDIKYSHHSADNEGDKFKHH